METTLVRQLLKNLCTNSPWSYAVFWKLQQQNHMLLAYEDGYYDYPKLQETYPRTCSSQGGITDFASHTNIMDKSSAGYPVRSAVTDISCRQYELGEGLVGRVAVSGNDQWIYSDDVGSIEFMSKIKYPDEWLLPITAGIKTTLLAPILPHGVLQLGSQEKVAESRAMVADIKDRLIILQCMMFTESFPTDENSLVFSSSLLPELERDESSFGSNSFNKVMDSEDSEEIHTTEIAEDEFSNNDKIMLPFAAGNCLHPEDVSAISQYMDDQDSSYMHLNHDIESNALKQFVTADIPGTTENVWTFSFQEEGYYDGGISIEPSIYNYLFPEVMQQIPAATDVETSRTNVDNFGAFSKDCELHKVLESAFQENNVRYSQSSYDESLYFGGNNGPLAKELLGCSDKGGDQEHLLEAVVTSLSNNSDDNTSYRCNSSRSSLTSLEEVTPSFQVQISYEGTAALTTDDTAAVHEECTMLSWDPHTFSLTSPSSMDSLASTILEDEQAMECDYGLSNKRAKVRKLSRGKARPKSSHRPRPRDRQLIQDRLNELRGLVPNSEKSSIDGLLDQTIKHLMFLNSVTEQAEKVKQFTDQELTAEIKSTIPAVEEEENHGSCPIVVKDLEHPGQILIQMLCNNDQVFFEMAQVIHQLKLTILKGVKETHSNNWAHFIVQTSMGFNRLDIFWPLMRILQRNGNWTMNQW